MKKLSELFIHSLQDIYYAEKMIEKELPKMASEAWNDELKNAFENHLDETHEHVARLEEIFEILGIPAKGVKCPAIDGILKEAKDTLEEVTTQELTDIALISWAKKVEHYEIGTYRNLIAYASALEQDDIVELLEETLWEEESADVILEEIGEDLYENAK